MRYCKKNSLHTEPQAQQAWAHNDRGRGRVTRHLVQPGDCNPHSGGISFAVGEDKPNQQQSALYVGVFSDVGER